MLEAFHPRDQLECMLAAQGVAAHCAIMDSFRCAADPNTPPLLAIKLRASAVAMNRMFCTNLHELSRLQSQPLPPRPGQDPAPPAPTDDPPPAPDSAPTAKRRARATTSPAKAANPAADSGNSLPDPVCPPAKPLVPLEDLPEIPEDIETSPDGTPGNLTAYLSKAPVVPYVPREAPIMMALATRPKPWRMVNVPKDQAPIGTGDADSNPPASAPQDPEHQVPRGPLDLRERIFTGDALARFAATRFEPDTPLEAMNFENDAATVELELISTGGDPSAEADKAAMMRAHPEGKPIVTFRYGTAPPASDPPVLNAENDPPRDN